MYPWLGTICRRNSLYPWRRNVNAGVNIRIMVTEHNAALRDGIVALINGQRDMRVVSTASEVRHAILEFSRTRPEVMIVDVDLPDAINLIRRLRNEWPHVLVLVLINYEWDNNAELAMEASGAPCLPKDSISQRLVELIRQRDCLGS